MDMESNDPCLYEALEGTDKNEMDASVNFIHVDKIRINITPRITIFT